MTVQTFKTAKISVGGGSATVNAVITIRLQSSDQLAAVRMPALVCRSALICAAQGDTVVISGLTGSATANNAALAVAEATSPSVFATTAAWVQSTGTLTLTLSKKGLNGTTPAQVPILTCLIADAGTCGRRLLFAISACAQITVLLRPPTVAVATVSSGWQGASSRFRITPQTSQLVHAPAGVPLAYPLANGVVVVNFTLPISTVGELCAVCTQREVLAYLLVLVVICSDPNVLRSELSRRRDGMHCRQRTGRPLYPLHGRPSAQRSNGKTVSF